MKAIGSTPGKENTMPYLSQRLSLSLHPYLDSQFLATAFQRGCLAASAQAASTVDPFVPHGPEECKDVPVLFSDLPDPRCREPKDIIRMSYFAQGVKS